MTFDEFERIINTAKRANPVWFGLDSEEKPEKEDILNAEKMYSVKLPEQYKRFLLEYGGGCFAFINIYNPGDNNPIEFVKKYNFLAISDNGGGDLYGFKIFNGRCNNGISVYLHDDKKIEDTEYSDVLEFIAAKALRLEG